MKQKVILRTTLFFKNHPELKVNFGDELFPSLYSSYEAIVKGTVGGLSMTQAQLREDSFDTLDEKDKVFVVFLYLECILNPEESIFFAVPDDKIKDKALLMKLQDSCKLLG